MKSRSAASQHFPADQQSLGSKSFFVGLRMHRALGVRLFVCPCLVALVSELAVSGLGEC